MTESIASIDPRPQKRRPLMNHPFRRKNLRLRVLAPVALAMAMIALAEPTRVGVGIGLPLLLGGCALRIWATGHLVKTDEFTISGPYAHLRHPLYAGTLAVGSGFSALAGWRIALVALPVLLGFFFGHYLPRKERIEGARLERLYGERYRAYRAAVRALVPSWTPWRPERETEGRSAAATPRRWSFERFRDNDELGTTVTVLLALTALALARLI